MHVLMRVIVAAAFLVSGTVLGIPTGNSTTVKVDPQPVAKADPSPDLMRALMAWASPLVGLPVPPVMPRIVRKNHCDLNAIARPGLACPKETRGTPGVLALYQANVLWLNVKWRSDSVRDVSFLLHELVHHMQFHAGVPETPCKAEQWEKPAYEAHFAFLEAAGLDPYEVTGINGLYLVMVTNCLSQR